MNKSPYRFEKKLLISYFAIIIAGSFIVFHLLNNYHYISYFLIISFFVLMIIQVYNDTIIPKIPKIIFLLITIIIITIIMLIYNSSIEYSAVIIGFYLIGSYDSVEKHYNENIDYNIFKALKETLSLIIIIFGSVLLLFILFFIIIVLI